MAEMRTVGPVDVERMNAHGDIIGAAEMTFQRLNGHVYILVNSAGRVQRFVMNADEWKGVVTL